VLFRKEGEQSSDFEGGQIRNKDGTLANEVRCKLLGHVIQYWDIGRGTRRYRCMEADRDHSAEAHELVMRVRRTCEQRFASATAPAALSQCAVELKRLDPWMMSVWVAEYDMNFGAWLRQVSVFFVALVRCTISLTLHCGLLAAGNGQSIARRVHRSCFHAVQRCKLCTCLIVCVSHPLESRCSGYALVCATKSCPTGTSEALCVISCGANVFHIGG
jgi:hypothetical protein